MIAEGGSGKGWRALPFREFDPWNFLKLKLPKANFDAYRSRTRNSSGDEIANVNFLYDDIVHALKIQ